MLKTTTRIIAFTSLFLGLPNAYSHQTITNIETFEWKNRIILIRENVDCKNTISNLKKAKNKIDERHVLWFVLCNQNHLISNVDGDISSTLLNSISKKYFNKKTHNIVLIGKDGGIKYRSSTLHLNEINTLIDSMPMRQTEMREAKTKLD